LNTALNDINLPQLLKQYVESNKLFSKEHHLLVACSGGVDSVVLVHLLNSLGYRITILHCNFRLRGDESTRDEIFVQQLSSSLNLDCKIKHFDTEEAMKDLKKGVQETARILRYTWFQEQLDHYASMGDHPLLLTAHHLDDQVETIAFNFFRGTGISGLTGMNLKDGNIVRPLLFASRAQILSFASAHKYNWVDDSSNKESVYARNQLRNEVFPAVEKVIPSLKQNLANSIKRFQEVELIYHQQISLIKKKLVEKKGDAFAIPVNKLKATEPLDTIIFEIFLDFGFTSSQIEELKKMLHADTGSYIKSETHRVLKNRDWLIIDPIQEALSEVFLVGKDDASISFGSHLLEISSHDKCQSPSTSMNEAWLDAKRITFPLILRTWKKGDYFYPLGMKKKKKVAKFLIDQKLSKTEKEKQFVIESNKKIVWVIGKRIDDRFKILPTTKNILKLKLK